MESQKSAIFDKVSPSTARVQVSIVMPCLNEAETLQPCILKSRRALQDLYVPFEVIVADNGSTDGSQMIAKSCGARVVSVPRAGYGSALMGGIEAATGQYIVMADADDSYDFAQIPRYLTALIDGADLVMGNGFAGGIKPGAMPALHRYVGNPVLSFIGRLLFKSPCGDFHCAMRAFTKQAYERMGLQTLGMEFASEMVVKATLLQMTIAEVPTTLCPDGRSRPPHLRTWHDGWRHLRFLLLYSPRWLFLYPGILLISIGLAGTRWLLPGTRSIKHVNLDVHTMLYALMSVMLGVQCVIFALFTKVFAAGAGLLPADTKVEWFQSHFSLETSLVIGAVLMAAGLGSSIAAVGIWSSAHFRSLDVHAVLRLVAPAIIAFTTGFQVVLSSFFLSILGMGRR